VQRPFLRVTYTLPTPTPTETPTPAETATPEPTATPTATSVPVYVQGYFPAPGGDGEAIVFFDDQRPPEPSILSYRIQVRRVDNPTVLVNSVNFNLPGGPGGDETHSSQFTLPLLDILILTSWEIDVQYKVQAFDGLNATGAAVFASAYSYASHPSADVADAPTFTKPPVDAGTETLQFTDQRPTARIGAYRYDVLRQIAFGPETQVGQAVHGIQGPFSTSAVHPPVTRSVGVSVVSGDLSFYVRSRREFRNSAGTSLGRYDIALPSPTVGVSVP
jgi:hypothetical protein